MAESGQPAARGSGPRPSLTVVVPVLDEEGSLEELHGRLAAVLPAGAEVIFVDDGSTDGSAAALRRIAARDPRVRVVRFRRNFGKSLALAAGFRRARGEVVATIDGDLQEDPADILRLADRLAEGHDVVGGWRRRRRDPWLKVLGSRAFNALVSLLGGVRFRDINCGLKVLRREVVEDLVLLGDFHRFIPLLAHWKGYRVAEAEVAHAARRHGRSRYGGERAIRGLLDLAVILFVVRHEGRPGRWFAGLGALLGLAGLGVSGYLAGVRLAYGTIRSQFPLLSLGLVLMVVGLQLFSLGLFGELLAYSFRSRRPPEPALWEAEPGAREEDAARAEDRAREEKA
ncbi:MAG: glycosyltransferase family 2 protein [Planctomycetes bacterium]|nr:glycosyltransferase family 2 protein [Planctomycetota bacterium]